MSKEKQNNVSIRVGIIGAMEVEVDLLRAAMGATVRCTVAGLDFCQGTLVGREVVVVRSGVGKVNAALCAQILVDRFGVTHIINTGVAGGVDPALGHLDLVISTALVYYDVDSTALGYAPTEVPGLPTSVFIADPVMADEAMRAAFGVEKDMKEKLTALGQTLNATGHPPMLGRIATGDNFVASEEIKEQIRRLCDPVCIDMEGAAIGHVAVLNGVPFLVIRCISDSSNERGIHDFTFNERPAAEKCALTVLALLDSL
jgi:adenosylhomocysteine nucleosidase